MEKRPNQGGRPGDKNPQPSTKSQSSAGRNNHKKKRRGAPKKPPTLNEQIAIAPIKQHDFSEYVPKSPKKCAFRFFETFAEARGHAKDILDSCRNCDQLNVVIRAEGDMNDAELVSISPKLKIFAGAAWALIHERRIEEKWYDSLH